MAGRAHLDDEKQIKRNPHEDFKKVEASRPDYPKQEWSWYKTPKPDWKLCQESSQAAEDAAKQHVEIDPYESGRPVRLNYKLLISGIVPRFIGFWSTQSKDGKVDNLAPFSYTTMLNHDPPMFIVSFASSKAEAKDTLKNLMETGEATLNVVSKPFLEEMNATCIDAPFEESEFKFSGLTPAPCKTVKCPRVKESVFSVECKLMSLQEMVSKNPETPGKITGTMAIVEGTRFWVREDAINDEKSLIDPAVLLPVARMGGITYTIAESGIELPRVDYEESKKKGDI